jgi:hypothetical protein
MYAHAVRSRRMNSALGCNLTECYYAIGTLLERISAQVPPPCKDMTQGGTRAININTHYPEDPWEWPVFIHPYMNMVWRLVRKK